MMRYRLLGVLMVLSLLAVPVLAQETPTPGGNTGLRLNPERFEDPNRLENGCVPPLDIEIGSFLTISDGVFVREDPDLNGAIIQYVNPRLDVQVIGGPVCSDGFYWWNIERRNTGPRFEGWVAEGRPEAQYIFPFTTEEDEACFEPLAVPVGEAVQMFTGTRVRSDPTLNGRVVTVAQADATALVNDGPVCADGYNWWNVDVVNVGVRYQGWIVEGFPQEQYTIDPAPDGTPLPCDAPALLNPGDTAILRFTQGNLKNLRTQPSQRADAIFQLPSGLQVEILSDPVCNEGFNWREVRIDNGSIVVTGWLAEGVWLGRFATSEGDFFGPPVR